MSLKKQSLPFILAGVAFVAGVLIQSQWQSMSSNPIRNLSQEKEIKPVSKDINALLKYDTKAINHSINTISKEIKGKPALINFWATWCPPCRKELPLLSEFQQRNPNISVIAISLEEDIEIENYINNVYAPKFSLYNLSQSAAMLTADYGNERGFLPFTIIINKEGKVIETILGELKDKDLTRIGNLKL